MWCGSGVGVVGKVCSLEVWECWPTVTKDVYQNININYWLECQLIYEYYFISMYLFSGVSNINHKKISYLFNAISNITFKVLEKFPVT